MNILVHYNLTKNDQTVIKSVFIITIQFHQNNVKIVSYLECQLS